MRRCRSRFPVNATFWTSRPELLPTMLLVLLTGIGTLREAWSLGRSLWHTSRFARTARLHRIAVPAPGGEAELHGTVEHLLSEPLDHTLPLWEDWVLEGLADGRWAVLTKVHHTMADGIAGTDLLGTLLDATPDGDPVDADQWHPTRLPRRRTLVSDAVRDTLALRRDELRTLPRTAGTAMSGLRHPRAAAESVYAAARGLLGYLGNARPTAQTSLLGPVGRARGYGWTEVDLDTVLRIHDRLGEPCPDCGTPIARVDFEEHTIYYCPRCQTGGRVLKDRRLSRLLR